MEAAAAAGHVTAGHADGELDAEGLLVAAARIEADDEALTHDLGAQGRIARAEHEIQEMSVVGGRGIQPLVFVDRNERAGPLAVVTVDGDVAILPAAVDPLLLARRAKADDRQERECDADAQTCAELSHTVPPPPDAAGIRAGRLAGDLRNASITDTRVSTESRCRYHVATDQPFQRGGRPRRPRGCCSSHLSNRACWSAVSTCRISAWSSRCSSDARVAMSRWMASRRGRRPSKIACTRLF